MSVIELWDGTDRDAPTWGFNKVTYLNYMHLVPSQCVMRVYEL
jgi:hypothetical protein